MDRNQLLPCPFCGSTHLTHAIYLSAGCIECIDCGAIGPEVFPDDDVEKAEAAWNQRSQSV